MGCGDAVKRGGRDAPLSFPSEVLCRCMFAKRSGPRASDAERGRKKYDSGGGGTHPVTVRKTNEPAVQRRRSGHRRGPVAARSGKGRIGHHHAPTDGAEQTHNGGGVDEAKNNRSIHNVDSAGENGSRETPSRDDAGGAQRKRKKKIKSVAAAAPSTRPRPRTRTHAHAQHACRRGKRTGGRASRRRRHPPGDAA